MITITYDIYRFYSQNPAEVYADKFKTVTTADREIVAAFEHAGKMYIGACYAGCKITDIVNDIPDMPISDDNPCPECKGTVGHRINCPLGIAFSD